MNPDQPAPIDTLYQGYSRGLYKITGEESFDNIEDMLSADSSANNSTSVQVASDSLSSGYDPSTTIQTTGSLQAGKSQYDNTVPGYILGVDPTSGLAKLYIGDITNYLNWDGETITLSGNVQILDDTSTLRLQVFDAGGSGGATFVFYATDGSTQETVINSDGIIVNGPIGIVVTTGPIDARGGSKQLNPVATNNYDLGNTGTPLRWRTIYLVNAPDVSSDSRDKTDIAPLDSGLNEIWLLNPVTFKRTGEERTHLGFLAQDVIEVLPEIVSGSEATRYGLSHEELIPVLVKAIQELTQRVIDLENNPMLT